MTRVVVHIRRLSIHGAGTFSAERFQERLATELEHRIGGAALAAEQRRDPEHRAASSVAERVEATAPELHQPRTETGTRSS